MGSGRHLGLRQSFEFAGLCGASENWPWSGRSRLLSDRSPTPQPELIPNLALQNLAVGVARQEVPNLDRFRRFDAAQRFPAESNDLRRVDLETCVGFDDGLYRLAPWSVGLISLAVAGCPGPRLRLLPRRHSILVEYEASCRRQQGPQTEWIR
jgi:hypothetical protein